MIRTLDFEPGIKVHVTGLPLIICVTVRIIVLLCVKKPPLSQLLLLFRHSKFKVFDLTSWGHRRNSRLCGKNTGGLWCQSYGGGWSAVKPHVKAGLEVATKREALLFSVPYSLVWFVEGKGLLVVYAKETATAMEQSWPVKDSMPYCVNQIIQMILSLSF